jgi:shikimate kinase
MNSLLYTRQAKESDMKLTLQEFKNQKSKAITLLGMSGVGKTQLANKLPSSEWFHYSGDYRIGTKYLAEPIMDNIKVQAMQVGFLKELLRSDSIYIASNITVNNLEPVATFLGKIGNPRKGGITLEEFRKRQALHKDAEINAMRDVAEFMAKAKDIYGYSNFINDAGGSLCELNDEKTYELLSEQTIIIYLKANAELKQTLTERAMRHPKPMYYAPEFLDQQIEMYLAEKNLKGIEDIDPDDFSSWIFPKLIEHRDPKYQRIADQYGYTLNAEDVAKVKSEAEFLDLLSSAIDAK